MSNQVYTSMANDSETIQLDHRSSPRIKANSMPVTIHCEDAFVSGALPVSEDCISFHTAPQGPSESISEVSVLGRTSLEALELTSSLVPTILPENEDAISTALPVSNDEDLLWEPLDLSTNNIHRRSFQEASPQEPSTPAVKSYASVIETLSVHLPHLTNVKASSRRQNISVTCYDYVDTLLASVKTFTVMQKCDELQTAEGMRLQKYLDEVPPENLQLRLIITNDLCTELINCLGTSFSMSPEVYEEHLVNSGWRNGMDKDPEPDTWITRDMKKNHMSIRWYRPVKRVLQRPNTASDRLKFLGASAYPFSWTESVADRLGKLHGVHHISKPATNIFRRGWDMKTDGEVNISAGGFTAWEERATLWNKQCDKHRVGQSHKYNTITYERLTGNDIAVLLLDPLPTIDDEMTGAAEALQKIGVYHAEPIVKHETMNEGITGDEIIESSATNQPARRLVKSRTFVRNPPKMAENFSLMSLGRLVFQRSLLARNPSMNMEPPTEGTEAVQRAEDLETGEQGRVRQEKVSALVRPRAPSRVPKIFGRLFRRPGTKTQKTDGADETDVPEEEVGTEKITLRPMNRCMFEGLYPRGPLVDYELLMDPSNFDLLGEHLDSTKSTAANIAEWLTPNNHQQPLIVGLPTHLECLFAIIHNDTANLLRHMELALQEIGQHILDDTLIQQRLVHWRLLLERFGTELQQLEFTLRRFAGFIHESRFPHKDNEESLERRVPSVGKLLEDSISQINALRQHTTRSHKSLMANMSIVESKRGIAEAESVTKLTELAFFFIPITFSASVFSMQVKELNASRISISAFFVLSIIVTTASYALRLLIRSQNFIDLRRKTLGDIRQDAGIGSGSSIPTTTFIAWLWRRFGLLTIIVTLLVALLIIPIAVLWTRDINHGFKILLTILLLVFILAASYYIGNAMLYIDARGLHFRRDIFKPAPESWKRPHHPPMSFSRTLMTCLSNRWVLIGLGAAAVGAGPAAALWTSQLNMGIKVGITVAIAIVVVVPPVFLAFVNIFPPN